MRYFKIYDWSVHSGKTDYADIELYREDIVFSESLKLKIVPSEESLRQRLDECGEVITDEVRHSSVTRNKLISFK